jgi:hypothetical protein
MRPLPALVFAAALFSCTAKPPSAPGAAATPLRAVTLTPADVTMIWPLPATQEQNDSMLRATSPGAHGELLPADLYEIPVLDQRDWAVKDPLVDRARLRVVAARLDPCFASFAKPDDPSCVNQIRLVLQVIRPGGGTPGGGAQLAANDGAVHAFYEIPREELLELVRRLAALRDRNGITAGNTLGVHPLLAKTGLGSEYARELQAMLLSHVGARRLTRVTFFARTAAREPEWPFGIFDVAGGKLAPQKIVTLGLERQVLEGAGPVKVVRPATSSKDNPAALLPVFGPSRSASAAERAAFAAALRIQNPGRHTPETMACAECHAAQRLQSSGEAVLGLRVADFREDHFASTVLAPGGRIEAENFHSCGYLGTSLAVSTRTANETAVVLGAFDVLLGNSR